MTIEKRIERLEAILDARGLDWDHPRVEEDHFAGADKMVAEEPAKEAEPEHPAGPKPKPGDGYRILSKDPPEDLQPGDDCDVAGVWVRSEHARTHKIQHENTWYRRKIEVAKEPEHPAGPKPDPGEGYRILSKDPPEDLTPGDEFEGRNGEWIRSSNAETDKKQAATCWYRRKIETAKPAWEPKAGDWVRVTRPENWKKCWSPCWLAEMNQFDGKVGCIERSQRSDFIRIRGFVGSDGLQYGFHRDWLSPAEPPKDEYREPVLPADIGKACQFSSDGDDWTEAKLQGYAGCFWISVSSEAAAPKIWDHARIKVDA